MQAEPQLQVRPEQHYAAIARRVTMDGIAAAVDDAFPALFGWLAAGGVAPAGPPFIRYLVIDMTAEMRRCRTGRSSTASSSMPGTPRRAQPGAAGPITTSPTSPGSPTRRNGRPTWLT
jgi:hypothetical protein